MARLYMDKNLVINEFKANIIKQVNLLQSELKSDIEKSISSEGKKNGAQVETKIDQLKDEIIIKVIGNAMFLFDNYGSGSKMDIKNNALIDEYIDSEYWNHYRSRSDTSIRGRDKGKYRTIFDKDARESSGDLANFIIEGFELSDGSRITATEPSHALETAIAWYKVNLPKALATAYKNIDFSKCIVYK